MDKHVATKMTVHVNYMTSTTQARLPSYTGRVQMEGSNTMEQTPSGTERTQFTTQVQTKDTKVGQRTEKYWVSQ